MVQMLIRIKKTNDGDEIESK